MGENVRETDDNEQSDAVLQSLGESFFFFAAVHLFPHVWHFSFSFGLCPSLSPDCLLPLSFSPFLPHPLSENSEICPDDKQRNKAKSDEVQRTFTPYSLLHTAELKTLFCPKSKKKTPPKYPRARWCPILQNTPLTQIIYASKHPKMILVQEFGCVDTQTWTDSIHLYTYTAWMIDRM